MELKPGKNYKIYFEDREERSIEEFVFSSEDLLHAIITCGMPRYYLTPACLDKRKYELFYKINAIQCALDERPDPADPDTSCLVLSEKLHYLDPSEKSVLSYYIGMFFTKLISEKIFHIPYLVHFSIAQLNHTIQFDGKERPDFIGYNLIHDNYSVFEAKGRINFIQATLDKACSQTRTIKYISGHNPSLRIANMTYFRKNLLHCAIQKPERAGKFSIDLPPGKFLRHYYQPVCELIDVAASDTELFCTPQNAVEYIDDRSYSAHISMPGPCSMSISMPAILYSMFSDSFDQVDMQMIKKYAMAHKEANDFIQIKFGG